MKKFLAIALLAGATLTATAAEARDGCGRGGWRGPQGRCHYDRGPGYGRGPGPGAVAIAPGLVIGNFYQGRGYWDGRRYYQRRERWHGGWRYR